MSDKTSWGVSLSFFVGMIILIVLTALPWVCYVGSPIFLKVIHEKADNICRPPTNVVHIVTNVLTAASSMQTPIETSLSVQASGHGGTTNQYSITASTNSSKKSIDIGSVKKESDGRKMIGFMVAVLLYVVLYGVFVYLTLMAFRSWRRHRKLNGDLSGVLKALRAEKDKEKRRAMQKKILDDMIDTYLDRPSSDE